MPLHDLTTPVTAPSGTVDLAPIRKQLDDILADDANDDKAAAALKAVVDAIKPYDDTDLKLVNATQDAALKMLSNKIDALPGPEVIKVSGLPLPDSDWVLALDVRKSADKRTTRLWAQVEKGIAKPIIGPLEDTIEIPTHTNATIQANGSYQQTIGDIKLNYRVMLNQQNEQEMTITLPAGLLKRVDIEGQDNTGTALELGGMVINANATNITMNQFFGNSSVAKVLWKFVYQDNSTTNYLIPLTR